MVRPRSDWSECYITKGCGYGKWSDWSECYTTKGCGYGKTWSECYTTKGCGYGKTKVRLVRMLYY